MTNRYVTAVLLLIVLVVVVFQVFKIKVGDIRPSQLPPKGIGNDQDVSNTASKEISERDEKSVLVVDNNLPLKIHKGFNIETFAQNLSNARDLVFSPQGTLLVSSPNLGKVLALPDKDGDLAADDVIDVLTGLDMPHGIAFYNEKLFVAEETRVVGYTWDEENMVTKEDKILFSLPSGGRHFTRTITFNQEGDMFISIGSTCDVCFEKHPWLAGVIISDSEGKNPRLFAKGLRNAVFITVNPTTNELWGTEMGRDFLGDDLPPDEINIIEQGKDYGWPVCFGNKVYDVKFGQESKEYCQNTEPPVYEIAAHSAPLGLYFIDSSQFPNSWQGDLLVAYHGSWNRSTPIGYKIVRLKIDGNKVAGEEDFLTGFLEGFQAFGRPVDLAFDGKGNLFISDDKAGVVYVVNKS